MDYDISEFPLIVAIPMVRRALITYHLTKRSAEALRKQCKGATLYRNPRFAMLAATPDTYVVTCSDKREDKS